MRIHSASVLPFPRTLVYETYRDRLSDIADEMTDIRKIDVLSRQDAGDGTVRIHNRWYAQVTLPAMAERVVKPEWRQWDDHAVWTDSAFVVDWRLEVPTFGDQVQCSGRNSFTEVDGGTRVSIDGDLQIRIKKIPGVPSILLRRALPEVEKFIARMIAPNLSKVNESLQTVLEND
jgi:hypothetical protein